MKTAITFSRQNDADLAFRKYRTRSRSRLRIYLKVSICSVHEMTKHIKSVRGRHNLQNCKNL